MSYYIKPKFKIGQTIFSIYKDEIKQIEIQSIKIDTDLRIGYLSQNNIYADDQSFATREEAEQFLKEALRMPFSKKDWVWEGNSNGIRRIFVESGDFFFEKDGKLYNYTINDGNCINNSCAHETWEQAAEAFKKQMNFKS